MTWRKRSQDDFNEEIESHLAHEADRLRARGVPNPAAAARRAFGNVGQAHEAFFDRNRIRWLENLRRDVRFAVRRLVAQPGFTLAAVLTLGLGIGLNTGVFSLIYAMALRPFAVRDHDRVVNVYQNVIHGGGRYTSGFWTLVSYPEYRRYRDATNSFEGLAAYRTIDLVLQSEPTRALQGTVVSCNYFGTLRVRIDLGRDFALDDCSAPGGTATAILSERLWRTQFGSDPRVIGTTTRINAVPLTIIGVAEKGFVGIDWQPADLWMPITLHPLIAHEEPTLLNREAASWLSLVGRLKPGVDRVKAQAEMSVIGRRASAGDSARRVIVSVAPGSLLNEPSMRDQARVMALAILGLSALVIVLAATNLINLLLARTLAQRREIGIRLSLGASRARLVGQMMTESLLLAIIGGALGMGLVYWIPGVLRSAIPSDFPSPDLSPGLPVLGYGALVSVITAVAFGLAPALQGTRLDLASSIKLADPAAGRGQRDRLRRMAVLAQVAGSTLLVGLAALFFRSLGHASKVDLGYRTDGIVTASIGIDRLGYDSTQARVLYDRTTDRLRSMPGVQGVALAAHLPLLSRSTSDVESEDGSRKDWAAFNEVTPEYFSVMGLRVVRGRLFTREETTLSERPAVISEATARALWPDGDAVGKRIKAPMADDQPPIYFMVVGIVNDAHNVSIGEADQPFIYLGLRPDQVAGSQIMVAADPAASGALLAAMPNLIREVDPAPLVSAARLEDRIALALRPAMMAARFSSGLGLLAVTLAVIGIYGVVSYGATQRAREFGIRIALGASSRQIARLALGTGFVVVGVGLVIGVLATAAVARLARGLLYGIGTVDPASFVLAVTIMGVTAGVAMAIPARRATAIDPIKSLRTD